MTSRIGEFATGTWTPALAFSGSNGDLSVTYSTQSGDWYRIRDAVFLYFNVVTSAFTHTTATGDLRVTGHPFTATNGRTRGAVSWGGITKANYTDVCCVASTVAGQISFRASGSGQSHDGLDVADVPSGGTVNITGSLWIMI